MCGRFAQVLKHTELKKMQDELKMIENSEQIEFNYNLAPTQTVAAVVEKGELRYPGFFRWGLVPSWMKELPASAIINVRSETITEKPSFKASFIRRRALVPANGFYEWRQSDKQPFFIHAIAEPLIYIAAIYDTWCGADGSYLPSLAIITTAADDFMQPLHHRMPLLISAENCNAWLDTKLQDLRQISPMLITAHPTQLAMYPVSKRVNNIRNNDPECYQEIALEQVQSDMFS
ncbi:MAG: SOS response-associated peptidase [Candidatus Cloacimonas sp.]|jgi:putative SOS response-associated peptidase YedK|nr:SOS response-associated peptidase [Candidatus Cloacimonas sp.]